MLGLQEEAEEAEHAIPAEKKYTEGAADGADAVGEDEIEGGEAVADEAKSPPPHELNAVPIGIQADRAVRGGLRGRPCGPQHFDPASCPLPDRAGA